MCNIRIGHGYDVHRLVENRMLVLGGVEIPFEYGLLGHSDADVLVHALMDALLGAAGERDIGYHFPDTSSDYKNADSAVLLKKTVKIISEKGLTIEYADMTVIAQKPKLSPYIEQMRLRCAELMDIPSSRVNVKATTEEKMGFTGREEGIAAHAVCILKEN